MFTYFIKGFIIGLLTGMPTGPIGAICLRTTLAQGAAYGLIAGLGSCLSDLIYGAISVYGITVIAKFVYKYNLYFRIVGSAILIAFGFNIFFAHQDKKIQTINSKTAVETFLSTFLLAMANPATIFSFLLVFSASGLNTIGNYLPGKLMLILGIFCGSAFWLTVLILTAHLFDSKINPSNMKYINKTLGTVILIFGVFILVNGVRHPQIPHAAIIHRKALRILRFLK
jgi:threonine/homoserine/homoserine lactone efflux protein